MIEASLTEPAVRLAIVAAGVFFLSGLLTGIWKYVHMATHPEATSPAYVDIAHRTSLFYSFAAVLVAHLAALSAWNATVDFWATAAQLLFFGAAIFTYIVHGILRDTDNQLRRPHRVGAMTLPRHGILAFMLALIAGEVGGFLVLFAGVLRTFGLI